MNLSYDGLSIDLMDCLSSFLTIIIYLALRTIILSSYPLVKPTSCFHLLVAPSLILLWISMVLVLLELMVVHPDVVVVVVLQGTSLLVRVLFR